VRCYLRECPFVAVVFPRFWLSRLYSSFEHLFYVSNRKRAEAKKAARYAIYRADELSPLSGGRERTENHKKFCWSCCNRISQEVLMSSIFFPLTFRISYAYDFYRTEKGETNT